MFVCVVLFFPRWAYSSRVTYQCKWWCLTLQSSTVLYSDVPITPSWLPVLLGPACTCFLFPSFCLKSVVNWITVHILCLIPKREKAGKQAHVPICFSHSLNVLIFFTVSSTEHLFAILTLISRKCWWVVLIFRTGDGTCIGSWATSDIIHWRHHGTGHNQLFSKPRWSFCSPSASLLNEKMVGFFFFRVFYYIRVIFY